MTDDATRAADLRATAELVRDSSAAWVREGMAQHEDDRPDELIGWHQKVLAVAAAYLAANPADDAEPVTAEWFESVGWGVTVTRTVVAYESGDLRVSGQLHDGVWHLFGRRVEGDCSLRCRTRGHVRRLLAALGVA